MPNINSLDGFDETAHPGHALAKLMDKEGFSQADLSKRTGITTKTINLIIKGNATISPETAVALESVLGRPAEDWMRMVSLYQIKKADIAQRQFLDNELHLMERLDLNRMQKDGWITKSQKDGEEGKIDSLKKILSFFGVASLQQLDEVWSSLEVNYRTSDKFKTEKLNIMAWLRKGEHEAKKIQCKPYDAKAFKAALIELRNLTNKEFSVVRDKIVSMCADAGVAVVFTPALVNIATSGAALWLSKDQALIQLSLRGKRNDKFWFDFYHEAGHVLLHGRKGQFIDSEKLKAPSQAAIEAEADEFSSNMLIPNKAFNKFVGSSDFSESSIINFANSVEIAPGIVVGRLQKWDLVDWKDYNLNQLKLKYEF